ncbi:MAG: ATP synthase F1 subunit gamma [Patescibacteria group bacterium]
MAISPRIIRRRIKSVANTRKITRAMELVAAAKMRRAVAASQRSRAYAALARDMLAHLATVTESGAHVLLAVKPVKRILLIVITSHRGLCGGFNANMLRRAVAQAKSPARMAVHRVAGSTDILPAVDVFVDVVAVGRKGEDAFRRAHVPVVASFRIAGDLPVAAEARPIAQLAMREFTEGKYEKVVVAYTDFISSLVQVPKFRQLLPISPVDMEKMLVGVEDAPVFSTQETIFEPDAARVLDQMLPRLVEVLTYQAMLESSASEHSSRMLAMRNASDAAEEMIDDLTLTYNGARQAGITREIAEIAAGSAAQE